MAHMILGPAQGAVGSLLTRLTYVLAEEAHKLGSVRNDMQFIKDEMESRNGFLLHVAESNREGEEDHRIQAWMTASCRGGVRLPKLRRPLHPEPQH